MRQKKSQIFIPVLVFVLIQNIEKSIHAHTHKVKSSHSELKCKHALLAQLWCFTPPTPQWPLFLSVFVVWAVGGGFLAFLSSSPLLFHLSAREKGKEKGWGE